MNAVWLAKRFFFTFQAATFDCSRTIWRRLRSLPSSTRIRFQFSISVLRHSSRRKINSSTIARTSTLANRKKLGEVKMICNRNERIKYDNWSATNWNVARDWCNQIFLFVLLLLFIYSAHLLIRIFCPNFVSYFSSHLYDLRKRLSHLLSSEKWKANAENKHEPERIAIRGRRSQMVVVKKTVSATDVHTEIVQKCKFTCLPVPSCLCCWRSMD